MIDAETELLLMKSANHRTVDTGTQGGAITATQILGLTAGEFFTRFTAKKTGTIDNAGDLKKQYAKGFFLNDSATDDLLDAWIALINGEKRPGSPGVAKFVPVGDETGKTGRVWGVLTSTGFIDKKDIALGTAGTYSGAKTWDFVIRRWIIDTGDGTEVDLADDCGLKVGSEDTGMIPGGHSWATEEVQLGVVATTDDTGTSTNRVTAPAGISFSRAYDAGTALSIRNDNSDDTLAAGEAQGFWGQFILQPTMEPAPPTLELLFKLYGEST